MWWQLTHVKGGLQKTAQGRLWICHKIMQTCKRCILTQENVFELRLTWLTLLKWHSMFFLRFLIHVSSFWFWYSVPFFCTSCHSKSSLLEAVESASHKPPTLLSLLSTRCEAGIGCINRLTSQVWKGSPAGFGMRPICPFPQALLTGSWLWSVHQLCEWRDQIPPTTASS